MGRIRSVKPELFTHDELFDIEEETGLPVRLAFIGLFTVADREGRFKWKPRQLKIQVLPYDDLDFSRVLDALSTRGFIVKYACQGKEYGVIRNFAEHQVINNKESKSKIPAPPENLPEPPVNTGDSDASPKEGSPENNASSTREPRDEHASSTPLNPSEGEGKGREGKGKEGKRELTRESRDDVSEDNSVDESKELEAKQIREVFEYWKTVLNHPRVKFTDQDKSKIRARLREGFSVEDLKSAVDGNKSSPFHQGANDTGAVHDGIGLIFRNRDKTRNFISIAYRDQSNVSVLTQKNQQAAQQAKAMLFGGQQ